MFMFVVVAVVVSPISFRVKSGRSCIGGLDWEEGSEEEIVDAAAAVNDDGCGNGIVPLIFKSTNSKARSDKRGVRGLMRLRGRSKCRLVLELKTSYRIIMLLEIFEKESPIIIVRKFRWELVCQGGTFVKS